MSKRSKAWTSQRSKLDSKEVRIKRDLEEASNDFEGQVKRIAIISLVSGVAVLGAYGLYKAFSDKPKVPSKTEPDAVKASVNPKETKVNRGGFSFRNLVMERVAMIALNFIGAQLTLLLSKRFGNEEDEDTED